MASDHFVPDAAAARFAIGRPDYSVHAAESIRRLLEPSGPAERALDVACGTGLSTRALSGLAHHLVGIDVSWEMLRRADVPSGTSLVLAQAEAIPLRDGCIDLVAVGSALHWFDRDAFASEALRVTRPEGRLVVHNHFFLGAMRGVEAFAAWQAEYLHRYPTPARDPSFRPGDDLGGWTHRAWERYEHDVEWEPEGLVSYLVTQSNVQRALNGGAESEASARSWLLGAVRPFFGGRTGRFAFGGWVALLGR